MKTKKLTRKQQFELIKEELDRETAIHGITYQVTFLDADVTQIVFEWEGATYGWYVHLEYLLIEDMPNWYIIDTMLHLIKKILLEKRATNRFKKALIEERRGREEK